MALNLSCLALEDGSPCITLDFIHRPLCRGCQTPENLQASGRHIGSLASKWLRRISTVLQQSRRPSGGGGGAAHMSEINKSKQVYHRYYIHHRVCMCVCVAQMHDGVCVCLVCTHCHRWLLPPLVQTWRLTLVSCTASGEVTGPNNIIYIVCSERLGHSCCIYATFGDLLVLPSPGPIHQMVVFHCHFIGTCP